MLLLSVRDIQNLAQDAMTLHDEKMQVMPTTEGAAVELRSAAHKSLLLYESYLRDYAAHRRFLATCDLNRAEAGVAEAMAKWVTALSNDAAARVRLAHSGAKSRTVNEILEQSSTAPAAG